MTWVRRPKMKWKRQYLLKILVAVATLAVSAWLAFIGFYANLVRIQSTLFSVSGVAFLLMAIGVIGVISCIALVWLPRPAGIVASLTMVAIAGVHLCDMVAKYRLEILISFVNWFLLPLVLAVLIITLFVKGQDDQNDATDDEH